MLLSEFLKNEKIKCLTKLSKENWKRLLNSDKRIYSQLKEWSNFDITISIGSINHADSCIRNPSEKGYKNHFYDNKKQMYVSYEIKIERNLSTIEKKKYNTNFLKANSMCVSFDLPISIGFTVLRADIQKMRKSENICHLCGNSIL